MPRYIDADVILTKFDKVLQLAGNDGAIAALKVCKKIVQKAPTISPDEARGVGKWIMSKEFKGYAMCSCCEDAFVEPEWIVKDGKWNYCPNCGARMKGASKDG